MFSVLQNVVFANDLTFFLGRGPGTVQEQFRLLSFNAFDPTWGKVIYEYGLLGALVYFRFFYVAFCRGPRGLRFAVGYTYLFLGGYLLNPSVLMQLAALVVWLGKTRGRKRPASRRCHRNQPPPRDLPGHARPRSQMRATSEFCGGADDTSMGAGNRP